MTVNAATIALIRRFEGCEFKPYRCPAGVLTVGIGHAVGQNETHLLDGITPAEAESLLREDLKAAERAVEKFTDVPLNENQYGALVSFVFNVGGAAYRDSTLRRAVNQRQFLAAADQFPRWVNAGGKPSDGLKRRRAAERALFLLPVVAVHNQDV